MICVQCGGEDARVVDSRVVEAGTAVRRRRQCQRCGHRFTTVENAVLLVVKRGGVTEPFDRQKVITGVRRACRGRPVTETDLSLLGQAVEEDLRRAGRAEVASDAIGLAVLPHLMRLDEVAYLRFASVYKAFTSAQDFEGEIAALRAVTAPADPEQET